MDPPFNIRHAIDGVEALAMLRQRTPTPLQRPYIVLLDLKMPRMGGLQFLKELRSDDTLRRTVVFVLSTSNSEEDRRQAYDAGVAGYLSKNQSGGDFGRVLQMLRYYLDIVDLP